MSQHLVPSTTVRMILIDDDPTYCAIMRKIAEKRNINLDIFPSIVEVSAAADAVLGAYAAAIIDYDLGQVNGVEITGYLGALLGEVPMIMVSATDRTEDLRLTRANIRTFVNKNRGFDFVLQEAAGACGSLPLAS